MAEGIKIKLDPTEAENKLKEFKKSLNNVGAEAKLTGVAVQGLEDKFKRKLSADKTTNELAKVAHKAGLTKREFNALGSDLGATKAQMKDAQRELKRLNKEFDVMDFVFKRMRSAIIGFLAVFVFKKALDGAVSFVNKGKESFQEFQSAIIDMAKVTTQSLVGISKSMLALPSAIGSATELTKGYYQVISSGVTDANKAMDILTISARSSKAAHIEQAETIKVLTKIIAGYRGEVKNATEASDLLFSIEKVGQTTFKELVPLLGDLASYSKSVYVSTSELGGAFALLTQTSGSSARAATQYKAVLTALKKPTTDLQDVLRTMGYTSAEAAIRQLGFAKALKTIQETAESSGISIGKLFRRVEALSAFPKLAANDFKDLSEKINLVGDRAGLSDRAFGKWRKSLEGISTTFRNTLQNMFIEFGEKIAPTVIKVLEDLTSWIEINKNSIINAFASIVKGIDWVLEKVFNFSKSFSGLMSVFNRGSKITFFDYLTADAEKLEKLLKEDIVPTSTTDKLIELQVKLTEATEKYSKARAIGYTNEDEKIKDIIEDIKTYKEEIEKLSGSTDRLKELQSELHRKTHELTQTLMIPGFTVSSLRVQNLIKEIQRLKEEMEKLQKLSQKGAIPKVELDKDPTATVDEDGKILKERESLVRRYLTNQLKILEDYYSKNKDMIDSSELFYADYMAKKNYISKNFLQLELQDLEESVKNNKEILEEGTAAYIAYTEEKKRIKGDIDKLESFTPEPTKFTSKILLDLSDKYIEALQYIEKLITIPQRMVEATTHLLNTIADLGSKFQQALLDFEEALDRAIRNAAEILTKGVVQAIRTFSHLPRIIGEAGKEFFKEMAGSVPIIIKEFANGVTEFYHGLISELPNFVKVFAESVALAIKDGFLLIFTGKSREVTSSNSATKAQKDQIQEFIDELNQKSLSGNYNELMKEYARLNLERRGLDPQSATFYEDNLDYARKQYAILEQLEEIGQRQVDLLSESLTALKATYDELSTSEYSLALAPAEFQRQKGRYQDILARARTGDAGAIQELANFLPGYLKEAQKLYASSSVYQELYAQVMEDTKGVIEDGNAQLTDLKDTLDGTLTALKEALQADLAALLLNGDGKNTPTTVVEGIDILKLILDAIKESLNDVYKQLTEVLSVNVMNFPSGGTTGIGSWDDYIGDITNPDNYGSIGDIVDTWGGGLFANGGVVTKPTFGMIGEAGYPEAVIPMKDYTIPVTFTGGGEQVSLLKEQNYLLSKLLQKEANIQVTPKIDINGGQFTGVIKDISYRHMIEQRDRGSRV